MLEYIQRYHSSVPSFIKCGLINHLIHNFISIHFVVFVLQRRYLCRVDTQNISTVVYDVILFQGMTLLRSTIAFSTQKVHLITRNLRSGLSRSALPLLLLTQPSSGHMAQAQCQPYCVGLQRCNSLSVRGTRGLQKHMLECRCSGGQTCNDLALYIHAGAAIDSSQPMEVCHVELE